MVQLNDKNFNEELKKRDIVLVDFFATWCGPCSMQAEVLNKMQTSRNLSFDIAKVNVDEAPELTRKYGIQSIPTLIIFKNNEAKKTLIGYTEQDEILKAIEELDD